MIIQDQNALLCYSSPYFKANPYAKHLTMPLFCGQTEEWPQSTRLTSCITHAGVLSTDQYLFVPLFVF